MNQSTTIITKRFFFFLKYVLLGRNVQHFRSYDGPTGVRNLLPSGEQQSESEADQFRRPFVGDNNHTIGTQSSANATAPIQAAHFSISIRSLIAITVLIASIVFLLLLLLLLVFDYCFTLEKRTLFPSLSLSLSLF